MHLIKSKLLVGFSVYLFFYFVALWFFLQPGTYLGTTQAFPFGVLTSAHAYYSAVTEKTTATAICLNGMPKVVVEDETTARTVLKNYLSRITNGSRVDPDSICIEGKLSYLTARFDKGCILPATEALTKLLAQDDTCVQYKAKPRDTIDTLCMRFGLSQEAFFKLNLTEHKTLSTGQTVCVSFPECLIPVCYTQTEVVQSQSPMEREYVLDPSMPNGARYVAQSGVCEITEQTYTVSYRNFSETNRVLRSSKNLQRAVKEIVHLGTGGTQSIEQGFSLPIHSGTVTSSFGMRGDRMHDGIDIGVAENTAIYAAYDGVVCFSGWRDGYGNTVIIDHQNGYRSLYAHCSGLKVKPNDFVAKGSKIALSGNTGRSTGPHLHFEIQKDNTPQNPAQFLAFSSL